MKNINGKGRKSREVRESRITEIEKLFESTANLNMQVDAKLGEISYWRNLASKTEVIFSSVNSGASRKPGSKIEDCVIKITDIEESLKNDMNKIIELKTRTMQIIDKIDIPEYKSLLIHRYICDKTWEEIAEAMDYSYVHVVNRLHPRALARVNKINAVPEIKE